MDCMCAVLSAWCCIGESDSVQRVTLGTLYSVFCGSCCHLTESSHDLTESVLQVMKLLQLEREGSFSNGLCVGDK